MEGAIGRARRVFELLDTADEVPEVKNAVQLSVPHGGIEFQNINFYYNEDRPVLKDVSLRVEKGKTVALVGGSGTGKTTILSLLPRFYDPLGGKIFVDGQDVQSVTKKSLRENISFVLQDTVLLRGTIKENIALGKPTATEEEIIHAAKLAQLDEFVKTLPLGYNTLLGDHGVGLSGGQRQRVAMARAFLKDSPILILDEPTSALDLKTESELMGALKQLMNRHTTLIVTHRIHTIHDADYIFVLNKGQIAEHGTGPELLKKNGLYKEMWDMTQG
jgi:ATP-binding cassette subfamily B protein/subfamily B ATP-binding cassette protein MsbA